MKIVRFIVKEDKRKGRDTKKTNIDTIAEEERKSLMREIIEHGLKRAGYKKETSCAVNNPSAPLHTPEEN